MAEIFSDSAHGKFPKTHDELTARLKSVASCINNDEQLQNVNVEFYRRAFRLLADCRLITDDTVRFLSDAEACANYDRNLKFPYNRAEGVLRKVKHSDDIQDAKGIQRIYHDSNMCVLCGGQEYLIANNWFADGGFEKIIGGGRGNFLWNVLTNTKTLIMTGSP